MHRRFSLNRPPGQGVPQLGNVRVVVPRLARTRTQVICTLAAPKVLPQPPAWARRAEAGKRSASSARLAQAGVVLGVSGSIETRRNCHARSSKHGAQNEIQILETGVGVPRLAERGLKSFALLMHRRFSLNRPPGQGVPQLGNVQPVLHGLPGPARWRDVPGSIETRRNCHARSSKHGAHPPCHLVTPTPCHRHSRHPVTLSPPHPFSLSLLEFAESDTVFEETSRWC